MSRTRSQPAVKDTYSTHDVAKICSVTPTTVIRWIEDGLIPAFKTVGGHRRVRREDLEKVCRDRNIPFDLGSGDEVGRILVVDDEPVVLDLVRDVVKDLSHKFDVEVARDAFDAGRLVATFRPQLIFLDLMMPGVDGFEVCKRLKADASTANSEVIAVTGYYTEANMERILAAGAVACLKKPLDVMEVRGKLAEAFKIEEDANQRGSGEDSSPTRVLVVAQNADFRSRVRDELVANDDGIEVLTAQTAEDGLLMAKTAPPMHVIVAISTPGVDGTDAISQLVNSRHSPVVVAVHDDPTEEIRAHARSQGARMCLPTVAVVGSARELLGL